MLIKTRAADRIRNPISFIILEHPKPTLKSSQLPILLPKRVSTNPSVQDCPAAIKVKITTVVEEELVFWSVDLSIFIP